MHVTPERRLDIGTSDHRGEYSSTVKKENTQEDQAIKAILHDAKTAILDAHLELYKKRFKDHPLIHDVLTTASFDRYREEQLAKGVPPGQMMYYPVSQLPNHLSATGSHPNKPGDINIQDFQHHSNTLQNRNMSTLAYSTIDPIAQREYLSSIEGTFPIGGTFLSKDNLAFASSLPRPHQANVEQGSQMGYTALFGPQDFLHPGVPNQEYKLLTSTGNHKEHRVNFRDRYTQGGTHMDTRHDDRHADADLSHRDGRNQSGLKSSLKYSKPPCLQNTSAIGLSMTGKNQMSMVAANNRTMLLGGDHDDLKLKLDRLCQKFLEKNKEKDAFKDTFFDEEIFTEELRAKNYFKLSLDLLKYALHSANQPKKKKEEKKAGFSLGSRR